MAQHSKDCYTKIPIGLYGLRHNPHLSDPILYSGLISHYPYLTSSLLAYKNVYLLVFAK